MSWAGLRGAVPIVLATIPLAAGVRGHEQLFDIVFVLVVDLHAAHRADAALGRPAAGCRRAARGARPRCRGGPAGPGRRRPAAGHASAPSHCCTGSRSASCGCPPGRRSPWSSATTRPSCPSAGPCCVTATSCWSSLRAGSARRPSDGCVQVVHRRPAGPVAGAGGSARLGVRRGLGGDADLGGLADRDGLGAHQDLVEVVSHHDDDPLAERLSRSGATPSRRGRGDAGQLDRRVGPVGRPRPGPARRSPCPGRCRFSAAVKPRSARTARSCGWPGRRSHRR